MVENNKINIIIKIINMKKILYSLTILFGLSLIACSEVDNLAGNGDVSPKVTIYSYDIPSDKDVDATVNLRFIPNSVCEKFYVLIEKKTERDIFVNNYGHPAYAEKVVANGVQYPPQILDILNDTLTDNYSITAVGVSKNGEIGEAFDFTFNGINWRYLGDALFTQAATPFGNAITDAPAGWYVSTNTETTMYKLENYYASIGASGYNMKLNWDTQTGLLKFYSGQEAPSAISPEFGEWMLPAPYNHDTYGAVWVSVNLNPGKSFYENGVIRMDFRMRVDAGTFAGW
jgi:hypothetical protein